MPVRTRWGAVFALILAGVIVALQLGKASIALPVLQRELMLSLAIASWVVGAYGLLGAVGGLPAGILASLFAARGTLIAGLATAGVGSIAGAFTDSGGPLIATRVVEGCGYLMATLAIPRLLRAVTAPQDLDTVMPLFGAHLPLGVLTMMLAGPQLLAFGWPAMWLANGAIALLWVLVIARLHIEEPPAATGVDAGLTANLRATIGAPGPILLALAFGLYTFQYMALAGLLPTLLVERLGLSIAAAGAVAAAAVGANVIGNITAGALLRMGTPIWAILTGAFVFMGVATFGVFAPGAPVVVVAALAAMSLGLTGLIPGSVHAAAPKLAPTSAMLAITLGYMQQVTNIGNLTGATAMAVTVETFGWSRAPLFFVAIAIAGLIAALLLRRAMRSATST